MPKKSGPEVKAPRVRLVRELVIMTGFKRSEPTHVAAFDIRLGWVVASGGHEPRTTESRLARPSEALNR